MIRSTNDVSTDATKTLIYGHHGWGKTNQARYYQSKYGPGFIISGESGLKTLKDVNIDYLPFSSWDGTHDPSIEVYSFKGIARYMATPDFKSRGYTWIMWDSATEGAQLCFAHTKEVTPKTSKGAENKFEVWQEFSSNFIGALKWFRDLPYHVLVTALAKESENDNGEKEYWPMVPGREVQRHMPGIFDNVFGGFRRTRYDPSDIKRANPIVDRYLITDEVGGWKGKYRSQYFGRLPTIMKEASVIDAINLLDMDETTYQSWLDLKRRSNAPEEPTPINLQENAA